MPRITAKVGLACLALSLLLLPAASLYSVPIDSAAI